MNYEHEKGINALRLCLNMYPPEHQNFEHIGLSHNNIGNMSGNARVNSGYITDNSSNEIHELPADFFIQIHTMLENVNESHKQEFEDMLAKIEAAHASGNKKECGKWFGQLFSLAFTADCITVIQPFLPLISWLITKP